MTANSDSKRPVLKRISDTGKSYTRAHEHADRQTQQQMKELLQKFRESEGE